MSSKAVSIVFILGRCVGSPGREGSWLAAFACGFAWYAWYVVAGLMTRLIYSFVVV